MFCRKTNWLPLFFLLLGYNTFSQTKTADSLKNLLDKTSLCTKPCINDTFYLSRLESLLDAQQKSSALNDVQVTAAKGLTLSNSLLNKAGDSALKKLFILFKARFINRTGNFYYVNGKADSAIYYYRIAIPLFKTANDSLRLARAIGNIGITYRLKDEYDSAVYYLFFTINNFKEKKFRPVLAVCYNSLSIIYRTTHIYNKALEFSFAALKTAAALNDGKLVAQSQNSISNIYKELENYQQSKKYMLLAYNGAKANNDLAGIGFTATNLALIYIHLNSNDTAITYAKEGLNAKLKVGNMSVVATSYEAIARVYEEEKNYDSAIYYFTKQIDTATKYKMSEFIKGGNYLLGNLYLIKNDYALAKKHLLTALELTRINPDFSLEINFALSELYEKLGDYKQSLHYYKDYKEVNDTLHSEDLARSVTQQELNALYEEQQQKQNEATAKQHAIEEQKLQTQRNLRNIFVIALAVAVIIASLLYNRYRLKQRATIALESKNKIINDQKEYAEKLREEADESRKVKEQFLANMSHEIRTPMNAIKGITELLSEKQHDEESLRYIHAISQSSTNLLVILNDVLDLSKIQAGKFFIQHVTFSLKEQLRLVYETLLVLANEKRIDLILNYDQSIPKHLEGDPVRINQVLYNLINNAIKFTDKGSVHVDVKNESIAQENKNSKKRCIVTFTVTDSGCGIPVDKQHTIFESFTQLASTKNNQQGTGLGLTISKLLTELMHGKIFLESTERKGSAFTVQLPFTILDTPAFIESDENGDEIITLLKGIRILIAEDNQYNRMMITDTLKKKIPGINFDVVTNGQEAIEQLRSKDYDIVLMDVRMPVMDGFAATEYIRNRIEGAKKNIPVIALTASVLRTDLEKCIAAGMNAYITKPFNRTELFNKMAAVLRLTNLEPVIKPAEIAKQTNLDYLKNFTENDTEEMRYYLNEFLLAVPEKLRLMHEYIEHKNAEELKTIIHAIKPMLVAVGINREDMFDEDIYHNGNYELYIKNAEELCRITQQALKEIRTVYENEYTA